MDIGNWIRTSIEAFQSWDLSDQIAAGAFAIAAISIAISFRSLHVAKGTLKTQKAALNLEKARDARKRPKLQLAIKRSNYQHENDKIAYEFDIQISNPSDSENSAARIELRIDYLRSGQELHHIGESSTTGGPANQSDHLSFPLKLASGEADSGLVRFEVPHRIIEPGDIRGYHLIVADTYGNQVIENTEFINEKVSDET